MDNTLKELRERLNALYEDWFDTLRAEVTEGGGLPEYKRSAVHLTYGLDAISRKIEEIRAELASIETAKLGHAVG